jgi:predicted nuclease with TOPRIM domain
VQLIHVQSELKQMHVENKRLRDMVNQMNKNYNGLKMHLATLMQIRNAKTEKDLEVVFTKENPSLNLYLF